MVRLLRWISGLWEAIWGDVIQLPPEIWPHTSDGVPILPGMRIWDRNGERFTVEYLTLSQFARHGGEAPEHWHGCFYRSVWSRTEGAKYSRSIRWWVCSSRPPVREAGMNAPVDREPAPTPAPPTRN